MAGENISARVRRLIAENELREAAALLYESFKDRNGQLAKIALVQINNQKRLSDQVAAGILSQTEINTEQAKLNRSLLYLADEHERLFEKKTIHSAGRKWLLPAIAAVAGLLTIFLIIKWINKENTPAAFDLDIRLHGPKGEQDVMPGGRVNVRLGSAVPQAPQPLDADGRASFREFSGKYLHDSVQLIYFPNDGLRYRVLQQSAATAAQSRTIRFVVAPVPDTTLLQIAVRNKKGLLADAKVTIDGKTVVFTDKNGFFQSLILKAPGAQTHLLIEKNGKRLFEQDITVSSEFKTLPIE